MTLNDVFDVAVSASPWLAAGLGVGTGVAGERAFRAAAAGEMEDRWRGSDNYFDDAEQGEEVRERAERDTMRIRAATFQSIAMYFAAGAAVEAAAASQHGAIAGVLVLLGLVFATAASVRRYLQGASEIVYTRAWYTNLAWSVTRNKYVQADPEEENAAFARDYPHEAAILRRRESRATRPDQGSG